MKQTDSELLKTILENIHHPERLDGHPWASRLFVREAVQRNGHLQKASPGQQLVAAVCELFPKTRPSTPPRRGKRLDTHWGEFGILAALYFAPLELGLPLPRSLRDAWGRIDPSILFYVYGGDGNGVSEQERDVYRLVSREPDVAAVSTLSDWHCKGIEKLADAIHTYETYLQKPFEGNPASLMPKVFTEPVGHKNRVARARKTILLVLSAIALFAMILGGYRAQRIYRSAIPLREDLSQLREIAASDIQLSAILNAGPLLSKTRQDFDALSREVKPVLWLGDWLGWLPVHGGDLAASRQLLDMTDLLLESAERIYAASRPLLAALKEDASVGPSRMVVLLNEAQPELIRARYAFDEATQIRLDLDLERLSPEARSLIEADLDRLLPLMDEGFAVGTALPRLLGAASDGPKTYLLLAQNEDELRPTGGFITAVGTLVVQNGEILRVEFVDSGELENWDRPYPAAPWQLQQYMNSPVLILRDANWFPDFPTSALYIEALYAYSNSHSVDGVIAFDQHLLVSMLKATGPIEVDGAPGLIDAENVVAFMRASKSPPPGETQPGEWNKNFINTISSALLAELFEGGGTSWETMGSVLLQALNEQHLLLQLDDPALAPLISRHGWDGATRSGDGDFLMVVDANVGFNKTNAVVGRSLSYDVDLTNFEEPVSILTVTHQNDASAEVPCIQWGGQRLAGQEKYPVDACYWNYMRVYLPAGTELLAATPQRVPSDWMVLNHGVAREVDVLDEGIDGLQAFGALMVVPGGEARMTRFEFSLPAHVVQVSAEGRQVRYSLRIEKQPGTLAVPVTIRVHLPNAATLESVPGDVTVEGNHLLIERDLRTDLNLEITFRLD